MDENREQDIFEDPALAELFKPVEEAKAPESGELGELGEDFAESFRAAREKASRGGHAEEEPESVSFGGPAEQEPEVEPQPEDPLPRRTPISAYANIFVCLFVLVVLAVLAFALPKPTESAYEKRELAKLPAFSVAAYMTKEYNEEVEAFFADTFPFRDSLVQLRAVIEDARGLRLDDVKIHGNVPLPSDDDIPDVTEPESGAHEPESESSSESASESASESSESSSAVEAPPVPDDGGEGEMVNNVFVYKDMAMELFGGSRGMAEYYASVVNDYAAKLGPSVKVYNVVVPTHVEFALPERYRSLSNSEKKNIDYIYSLLDGSVTAVDAYSKLAAHAGEYIYFKTDHHWTGLGAYYAYTAFAEAAGFTAYDYEDYVKHTITPFTGSLYGVTGQDQRLANAGDYVEWCEIPVEHNAYHYLRNDPYSSYSLNTVMAMTAGSSAGYSVYLYGDYPLTVAETGIANGRRALIIKESYGNAFSTYLVPHYEKTYIADERYFQINLQEFVKEKGITDVIIVNNCFAANTNFHITNISDLLYQTTPSYELVQQWKAEAAAAASAAAQESAESSEEEDEEEKDPNEVRVITG